MKDATHDSRRSREFALFEIGATAGINNVQVFPMYPSQLEQELMNGTWVVLAAALWSCYDRESVQVAISLANRFDSNVRFGIRPFDHFEELTTWCHGIDVNRDIHFVSPIWLFMKGGVVARFYVGPHLGKEGEERLYRRIMGWLHGSPKELPPSDFTRLTNWIASFWRPPKKN